MTFVRAIEIIKQMAPYAFVSLSHLCWCIFLKVRKLHYQLQNKEKTEGSPFKLVMGSLVIFRKPVLSDSSFQCTGLKKTVTGSFSP